MSSESFVYWLQGYFEIADPKSLGEKEIQIIKDHLDLVLKKETPNRQISLPPNLGTTLKKSQYEDIQKSLEDVFEKTGKLPHLSVN